MQRNIDNTTTRHLKNTRTLQKPAQTSYLNGIHNLTIPLARLPMEIIIIIFKHCIGIDSSGHAFSKHAMPWVLSQVSSQWRSICLCTPSLWVIARVNTHFLDNSFCHDHSLNMLRAWLERSRPLPVSCIGHFDQEKPLSFHLQVLDMFIQESRRWSMVVFDLGTQAELYYRLSSVHPHLPLLHFCDIAVKPPDMPASGNPQTHIWHTPRLKCARILINRPSRRTMEIIPSSTRLEELAFRKESPTDFFILAPTITFEHLRYCHLNIVQESQAVQNTRRCVIPRLQYFDLFGHAHSVLVTLDSLILPSIRYLDVDFRHRRSLGALSGRVLLALGGLQARSGCHIYRLTAPFSLFSCPNTPTLTKRFGPVYELRILLSPIEKMSNKLAFHHFTHAGSELEIFEQVTTLHVLLREDEKDEATVKLLSRVVDMLESRLSSPRRSLERLSFDSSAKDGLPVHIEPVDRILKLAQASGVVLLGSAVDGKWVSIYTRVCWSLLDYDRAFYRWNQSGRCDWVAKERVDWYQKNKELWERLWSANISAGLVDAGTTRTLV
ncbi:hypothetical protein VNI00_008637 [Paramarasmius palmivorus]|uniref:F-box domain-containing protein n=1 Tax=Paramarasmius palmivorus TaxID=297713 RepID=A0AAW0CWE5_9AGAR